MQLWNDAMAAINAKNFDRAEEIAKQMHVRSDAELVRKRIAERLSGGGNTGGSGAQGESALPSPGHP
jgi:hypothetical protein